MEVVYSPGIWRIAHPRSLEFTLSHISAGFALDNGVPSKFLIGQPSAVQNGSPVWFSHNVIGLFGFDPRPPRHVQSAPYIRFANATSET